MTLRTLTLALVAAGLSTASLTAHAGGRSTFEFITSPEPGGPPSEALAINDDEQIYGTWEYHGDNGIATRATGIMFPTADIGKPVTIPIRSGNDLGAQLDGNFLLYNGNSYDLRSLMPGLGGTSYFNGINNHGTVVGAAPRGDFRQAFRLILQPDWQGGDGSWSDAQHWNIAGMGSLGIKPGAINDVVIAPTAKATILGASSASVRSLNITGTAGQIVTFDLHGGKTITSQGTTLNANAVLTGNGRLGGGLTVQSGGLVTVGAKQSLQLTGAPSHSAGVIRLTGTPASRAELSVTSGLTIDAGGELNTKSAKVDVKGGLVLSGQLNTGPGRTDVSGKVTATSGGQVIVAGGSSAVFQDQVEFQSGSELRVNMGGSATFMSKVVQRTGAKVSGTGAKNYKGGLSIGASPGAAHDDGDVSFGEANTYLAEIGGTTACNETCATDEVFKNHSHDKYTVGGHLSLGGKLELTSWQGFVGQAGQHFDLFDWGSVSGEFSSIDASGFHTAAGTKLDVSKLYSTGEISVVSVPEADAIVMAGAGLAVMGLLARRRRMA